MEMSLQPSASFEWKTPWAVKRSYRICEDGLAKGEQEPEESVLLLSSPSSGSCGNLREARMKHAVHFGRAT